MFCFYIQNNNYVLQLKLYLPFVVILITKYKNNEFKIIWHVSRRQFWSVRSLEPWNLWLRLCLALYVHNLSQKFKMKMVICNYHEHQPSSSRYGVLGGVVILCNMRYRGGVVGVGEGVELNVLITRWRAAARAGRTQLRNTWFPTSLSAIREAALATNLSPSRRHTVMHAFNNLLASKVSILSPRPSSYLKQR